LVIRSLKIKYVEIKMFGETIWYPKGEQVIVLEYSIGGKFQWNQKQEFASIVIPDVR